MAHKLSIEIPRDLLTDEQIDRLKEIINEKADEIKSRFGTDTTDIDLTESYIAFPWFEITDDECSSLGYIYYVHTLLDEAKSI